jgi:hypothetical protein
MTKFNRSPLEAWAGLGSQDGFQKISDYDVDATGAGAPHIDGESIVKPTRSGDVWSDYSGRTDLLAGIVEPTSFTTVPLRPQRDHSEN